MVAGISIAMLLLGCLPLIAYPGVVIASVMGLGGEVDEADPRLLLIVSRTFYLATLAYPIAPYYCVQYAWRAHRAGNAEHCLAFSGIPLLALLLIGGLFLVMRRLEKRASAGR